MQRIPPLAMLAGCPSLFAPTQPPFHLLSFKKTCPMLETRNPLVSSNSRALGVLCRESIRSPPCLHHGHPVQHSKLPLQNALRLLENKPFLTDLPEPIDYERITCNKMPELKILQISLGIYQ